MNLQNFNQITLAASKFWKQELNNSQKIEKEVSTKCGCHELEQSLLETSTNKIQQYLFPEEENSNYCLES